MKKYINITLTDGTIKQYPKGLTGYDIALEISKSLAKQAIAIKLNGKIYDISYPIDFDANINIIKRSDDEALELIRHDCAHVMAEAVQSLFPGTQVTIGPAIENGFYYDFARDNPFTTNDLSKIEKKMIEIINKGEQFTREVWSRDEVLKKFSNKAEMVI